jgi:hypothetical protein
MKKSIICISVLVSVVLLVGASLTDSYAGTSNEIATKRDNWQSKPKADKNAVTIASTVSGPISGRVRAGKYEVMITKRTTIYKNGKGMIDQGTYLSNAPVYIVGVARDGVVYAQLVIVSDSKNSVKGGQVRKLGSDEPR